MGKVWPELRGNMEDPPEVGEVVNLAHGPAESL